MMRRMLLTLLLSVTTQVWAAEPRELTWNDMIPPDAPVVKPITAPIHDMSKLSDALAMEAAPAAHQLAPHAQWSKHWMANWCVYRATSYRSKSVRKAE